MTDTIELHAEEDCPGDGYDIECHDGNLYGPCGAEFCYGADFKVGNCGCACHD